MSDIKTMAEVLADHHSKHYDGELGTVFCLDPTCSWDAQAHNFAMAADVFAEHQQDMLAAAGFGLMAAAKGEALEWVADDFSVNLTAMSGPRVRAWLRARAAAVSGEG